MNQATPPTAVSLVFDDGFLKSCLKISKLFESKNLRATFAVLVNDKDFMPHLPKGNFDLWNDLRQRGHAIHPHGYDHSDLTKIPLTQASQKINDCLDHFESKLKGFVAANTCYHFTYNRSTPEIDAWLLNKVRAIRTTGPDGKPGSGMNNAASCARGVFSCAWSGPEPCGQHLLDTLERTANQKPKQMTYMLHGLDGEGWGPIASDDLSRAIDYIQESVHLQYAQFPDTL